METKSAGLDIQDPVTPRQKQELDFKAVFPLFVSSLIPAPPFV